MSIACPHCKAGLTPRELKPGRYQPKCLKCSQTFVLEVQWVITTATAPKPVAAPDATGDFTEAVSPPHGLKKTSLTISPPATRRVAAADPNATGDFTEVEATPKPVPKPVARPSPKPAAKADPGATGDFTDVDANRTGDFTEPEREPSRTLAGAGPANGDFSVDEPAASKAVSRGKSAAAVADVPDDYEAGSDGTPPRLGGYEVLKVLGRGGMGAVLLGRQVSLDRKVALKVMHAKIAKNPTFVARFTREAYAAAQLTHHNVVQIYDIGEDKGQHFFSMEFVAGKSLADLVKTDGKVAPDVAVGYILQAARGLRFGHLQGMVHRDIKPDNLMLNTEGVVKVADLGLVKLPGGELPRQAGALAEADEGEPGGSHLTRAGAVMGTPAYMPPEQARDSATVDHRADIYSLGCTLYVLVTGRPPFEGKTALEVMSKHQTEAIVPPEVVVKRVPKALSAILLTMLAKDPTDRYQTMDDVIAALEGLLGVDRTGPFSPTEEQADALEKFTCQFNVRGRGKFKATLAAGFTGACLLGVVGAAVGGMPALAGGLLGLLVMAPLAYSVTHGTTTGSVVFTKVRALVFGMRLFDWLTWVGGAALFVVTLYLFGMLWAWLGFAVLAAGLGVGFWFLTDRAAAKAQAEPLAAARGLFKTMRLLGLEEDALRQFACKFAGPVWEPFYEALFGYEAKLAARAYRKGNTGEESKPAGPWREPVVVWIDARLDARRRAAERRHLQRVEGKALEAEGVSKAEAKVQAEAMAADLVDQAAEAKQARKDGKEASVRAMVAAARERRPPPGFTIAGKKHRSLWMKDFLNEWLGRRLRFAVGAVVFAAGLVWMSQNHLLGANNNVFKQLVAFDFEAAGKGLDAARGKPLSLSFVPAEFTAPVNSYAVPITGFLLILSGLLYFGWRPSLAAIPGAAIGVLGPTLMASFGVPGVDPLSPQALSLIVAAVLILVVGRFLRQ